MAKDSARGIGDNGPSDDDITVAISEMVEWDKKRKDINAAIAAFRKNKKAEGITLGVLDETIRMLEWTPEEIKAHFAERGRYAQAAGMPVGTQFDLFGTSSQPQHEREASKWFSLGKMHGAAGFGDAHEPPDGCPPEHKPAYARGHEVGDKELNDAIARRKGKKVEAAQQTIAENKAPAKKTGGPKGDEEPVEGGEPYKDPLLH